MSSTGKLMKLGVTTKDKLDSDFDRVYDYYKGLAKERGMVELKFMKEKDRVYIYGLVIVT